MIDPARFVAELDPLLEEAADARTKDWWDRLALDGTVPQERLAIAQACMARPDTEDKLAGVLVLAEHGLDQPTRPSTSARRSGTRHRLLAIVVTSVAGGGSASSTPPGIVMIFRAIARPTEE